MKFHYRADGWECSQGEWIRTIHVLHHFKKVLNQKYKSENCNVQLLLLCGGDVIESITKLAVSDDMLWNAKQVYLFPNLFNADNIVVR